MGVSEFKERLSRVAEQFKEIPEDEPMKVVSNLDADGISACAIMVKALKRLDRKHSVRILHQLREKELVELSEESYDYYVFTDLGSGDLPLIERVLGNAQVLVLDHHNPHGEANNVWHVNPHLDGVNGSEVVSASGITFLFCRELDSRNEDMADIAIVGAIGDVQEDHGFEGLNEEILDIGVEEDVIEVRRGLAFYGKQTRPLHKLLEYSSDVHVPGVSGSESGAIQFLNSLGIKPQEEGDWRFLEDLTEEEMQSLVTGLIMKRSEMDDPEAIFAPVYRFPHNEGVFSNAKEFATLLNACGRLDRASVGVGACLGNPEFRKEALEVKDEYTAEIVDAMEWFEDNRDSDKVIEENGYVIINAEDNVLNTVIGTLISILSKSGDFEPGTVFLSMARKPENTTKLSIRVADNPEGIHLRDVIGEIVDRVDGEYGGHQYAAGGLIDTDKEEELIDIARGVLENLDMDE